MQTKLPMDVTAEFLSVTPSTMDTARTYQGPTPHWIVALSQTNARGRRGRSWLSAEGAFAATLVLTPNCSPQEAACRSFVAACALRDALSQITTAQLSQKWPNDVLLNGGKVAGILLEAQGDGTLVNRLSIGIGVNLGHGPTDVRDAAFAPVGVADTGTTIPPEDFLPILAHSFQEFEFQMHTQGFAPIKTEWTNHAARIGETITAKTTNATQTGTFQGIDDSGNLLLLTKSGQAVIPAADVYF
ncbi:MAG: biotin--[acetyl-CoA-carboxylase] ligase [Planktomarina sp.]